MFNQLFKMYYYVIFCVEDYNELEAAKACLLRILSDTFIAEEAFEIIF